MTFESGGTGAASTASGMPAGIDLAAVKKKQQATWASGDFGRIGVTLQIVGESLCEAVDLLSTETVLDVAAGDGNASLARLLGVAKRLVQDRHRERLKALRHVHALAPVDHQRQHLVLASQPLELGTQSPFLQVHQRAAGRADQRVAQVA